MKAYINKIFVLSILATLLSCADLSEKPVGLLAPESMFNGTKDVETAIFGAYGWIATERLYGR
jgi:hypothetical protein